MDKRTTNAAWLSRINVLRAWAGKERNESREGKSLNDERSSVLTVAKDIWRRKREGWLSRPHQDGG
jgi:hypothetical protein